MAIICEQLGADVYKVRELLNKSPGRAMLMPGAGVGGHCIPKDPWLLIANVKEPDKAAQLIPAARAVNGQMPYHMVELLESALAEHHVPLQGARIAVLGYTFREDTDDDRDSPTQYFVEELARRGAIPIIHDPHVPAYCGTLTEIFRNAQAAVLMVAHNAYKTLDLEQIYRALTYPIFVDGRHVVDASKAKAIGFTFRGVGQSQ
jgi:UDP-N-acetyl-D-mannosaminuronic acid dehydrogenase